MGSLPFNIKFLCLNVLKYNKYLNRGFNWFMFLTLFPDVGLSGSLRRFPSPLIMIVLGGV